MTTKFDVADIYVVMYIFFFNKAKGIPVIRPRRFKKKKKIVGAVFPVYYFPIFNHWPYRPLAIYLYYILFSPRRRHRQRCRRVLGSVLRLYYLWSFSTGTRVVTIKHFSVFQNFFLFSVCTHSCIFTRFPEKKEKTLIKEKTVFSEFSDSKKKNYYTVSIFILIYLDTIVITLSLVAV